MEKASVAILQRGILAEALASCVAASMYVADKQWY